MSGRTLAFTLLGIAGFSLGLALGRRGSDSGSEKTGDLGNAIPVEVSPVLPAPSLSARSPSSSGHTKAFEAKRAEARLIDDFPARYERIRALFLEWKRTDPDAAFEAWAATPEALGMGAIDGALRDLRRRDGFDAVLARVLAIEHVGLKTEALRTLGHELYDLPEKREAIDSLMATVPDALRSDVLSAAVQSWTMKGDFTEIVAWIDGHSDRFDDSGMAQLERAAVANLVASRPEEAITWLTGRATVASLPEHLAFVAQNWARFAPNATGEWLGSLPPGPQNDAALEAFAQAIGRDDPESAAHWATTITDAGRRRQSLANVLSAWRRVDPNAAAAFERNQARGSSLPGEN